MSSREEQMIINAIELWKAIHGGCWPGPPIDRLTTVSREVLQSLSLLGISHGIADKKLAKGLADYAIGQFNTAAKAVGSLGAG